MSTDTIEAPVRTAAEIALSKPPAPTSPRVAMQTRQVIAEGEVKNILVSQASVRRPSVETIARLWRAEFHSDCDLPAFKAALEMAREFQRLADHSSPVCAKAEIDALHHKLLESPGDPVIFEQLRRWTLLATDPRACAMQRQGFEAKLRDVVTKILAPHCYTIYTLAAKLVRAEDEALAQVEGKAKRMFDFAADDSELLRGLSALLAEYEAAAHAASEGRCSWPEDELVKALLAAADGPPF